jgi:hypothetical protein
MVAAAAASIFFLTAFLGAREAAVAALPDLAGLYAAVGLPVNLDRLSIEDVSAERSRTFEGLHITISATIRNLGTAEQALPPIVAALRRDGSPLAAFGFDAPQPTIGGSTEIPIVIELSKALPEAKDIELRFLRPGEKLPAGGVAELAEE